MFLNKNISRLVVFSSVSFIFAGLAQAALPARQGLHPFLSAGVSASYGKLASDDSTTLVSRNFGVYGVNGDLGISLDGILIGAGLEYDLWKQLKDPSDLNNSNAQGNALSIGPSLGYNFGSFSLLGRYYLSSTYKLSEQNSSAQDVSYSKPSGSFVVQLRVPIGSGTPYVGLEYKSIRYQQTTVAGTESTLSSIINSSAYGLLFGVAF